MSFVKAGVSWLESTPPAPPPEQPFPFLDEATGEATGEGHGGTGAGGAWVRARAAASAPSEPSPSEPSPSEPSLPDKDFPPVVWLLWVAPLDTLDYASISTDSVSETYRSHDSG